MLSDLFHVSTLTTQQVIRIGLEWALQNVLHQGPLYAAPRPLFAACGSHMGYQYTFSLSYPPHKNYSFQKLVVEVLTYIFEVGIISPFRHDLNCVPLMLTYISASSWQDIQI